MHTHKHTHGCNASDDRHRQANEKSSAGTTYICDVGTAHSNGVHTCIILHTQPAFKLHRENMQAHATLH